MALTFTANAFLLMSVLVCYCLATQVNQTTKEHKLESTMDVQELPSKKRDGQQESKRRNPDVPQETTRRMPNVPQETTSRKHDKRSVTRHGDQKTTTQPLGNKNSTASSGDDSNDSSHITAGLLSLTAGILSTLLVVRVL